MGHSRQKRGRKRPLRKWSPLDAEGHMAVRAMFGVPSLG